MRRNTPDSRSLEREFELFVELTQIKDDQERNERLESLKATDPAMATTLLKLLSAHLDTSAGILDTSAPEQNEQPTLELQFGEMVGEFRIVRLIGEGGMSQVYLAEQQSPCRRVAIKVLRGNMNSSDSIARFAAERAVLARLDHPGIAKIFDAGQTQKGNSYFAMELIAGSNIIQYCNTEKLPLVNRLQLFRKVCLAVHHAHQKGIVHRDLKPSNVLVAEVDGEPTAKVIDFGVAKALTEPLVGHGNKTKIGTIIGTPRYMSPEQFEGDGLDVDTRSDVYSLGVILYQILTEQFPHDFSNRQNWLKTIEQIRNSVPLRPSLHFASTSKIELPIREKIAQDRGLTPASLMRQLAGDLDWITLRAVNSARSQRYDSAAALAADIQRHLDNEPVEAVAPALTYRAKKFVTKHRVACSIAGVSVFALAVSTILAGYWAISAVRANSLLQQKSTDLKLQIANAEKWKSKTAEAENNTSKLEERRKNVNLMYGEIQGALSPAEEDPNYPPERLMAVLRVLGRTKVPDTPISSDTTISLRDTLLPDPNGPKHRQLMMLSLNSFTDDLSENSLLRQAILEGQKFPLVDVIKVEIEMLEKIYQKQKESFGEDSSSSAATLHRLARRHLAIGQPREGLLAVERAMHAYEATGNWEEQIKECKLLRDQFQSLQVKQGEQE